MFYHDTSFFHDTSKPDKMDKPQAKICEAEFEKCTPQGAFLFLGGRNCGNNWKN
jgi:hypothetical protein